jgi:large subunit ribosomal protein L13
MRTYAPKPRDVERRWYVIDADGQVLGRLASEVAKLLRGKHKPIYAPHADVGDHVVVVNARGVRLTGGKEGKKVVYRHSGYPGGLRATTYERLLAERPARAVERAVRGMLPKNRLGRAMIGKLKVYEGPEHPHAAQKPAPLALGEVPAWDGLPERGGSARPAEPRAEGGTKAPAGRPGTGKASAGRPRTRKGPAKAPDAGARRAPRRRPAEGGEG